jgi:hypothetical protein
LDLELRYAKNNGMLRIAMLSYHTCLLAALGGKDTGGMNVYVRDLTRELGRQGLYVDVFLPAHRMSMCRQVYASLLPGRLAARR